MNAKPEEPGADALLNAISGSRDEVVATLQEMVRMPSITGDEAEIGEYVAQFCREIGMEVQVVEAEPGRPNIIAQWKGDLPGPTLLLNDHLDVVPPGPLEYWSHPPFAANIVDGRMYGRGTIDTKSGLTTILMATKAARSISLPIRGTLTLIFSCDEEAGGGLGMQFLARNGYVQADMAVVAEPTTLQVEIGTKGRLLLEIVTRGLATHGARPWLGHNAIEDMSDILSELRSLAGDIEKRTHPFLGQASLNIGRIDGGTVPNMVPDRCSLHLDRRVLPNEDPVDAEAEIQTILDRVKSANPRVNASLKRHLWWPGYLIDENEQIVNIVTRSIEQVLGRRPKVAGKDAGTDASWINQLTDIPVVMFSPGDGLQAMNANESVAIDDVVIATKVMGRIIYNVLVG